MANKTNTTKLTKKDFFSALMESLSDRTAPFITSKGEITADQMNEFLTHEVDLLTRKNSGEKKPTATQKQNELVKQGILADLTALGHALTVTDMTKVLPSCAGLSAPKVSAMVTQLVECKVMQRAEIKRRAYFGLPEWDIPAQVAEQE